MKDERVCRTIVSGGTVSPEMQNRVKSVLYAHNFVNRLDIVVKNSDLKKVMPLLPGGERMEKLLFSSTLNQLLRFILQLDAEERRSLKLVTSNKDITHENSICVSRGLLTLKLNSETYLQSGFKFKLSAFSHGNKRFQNQMYIHTFDLLNLEQNVSKNSKNDLRLFWFAENITDEVYEFMFTSESDIPRTEELKKKLSDIGTSQIVSDNVRPKIHYLLGCPTPDLSISKNEESLTETLEWLSYTTIGGTLLQKNGIDPYISRYPSMLDVTSISDVAVITFNRTLISSNVQIKLFDDLTASLDWFAVFSYGVKNTTRSFNNSNEHSFVDDGVNDIVIFVNENKYAFWKIIDSGDSYA